MGMRLLRKMSAYFHGKASFSHRRAGIATLHGGGAVIVALIILLVGGAIVQGKASAHRTAEVATANLSLTLADNFNNTIRQIDSGIMVVLDQVSRPQTAGKWDENAVVALMSRQMAREPGQLGFRIYGGDGRLRYGVGNISDRNANISQRDDFKYLRETPEAGLMVGAPLFDPTARQWLIPLSRRISDPDGSFGGAVYSAIPIESLRQTLAAIDVGAHGVILLTHNSFKIAAWAPIPTGMADPVGTDGISAKLRDLIRSKVLSAQYDAISPVDGMRRAVFVRRIEGQPYYILVALAEDDYLAEWRRNTTRFLFLGAVMVGLVLMGVFILHRRMAALATSEEKLRGLFELSPLGIARNALDGRFVEFNEAFREITGYPGEELLALDYWALTPEKYRPDETRQLESLRTTGRYGPYEKEYLRKSGAHVPIRLRGMLVTGRGASQHIWSLVEDISQQKRADAETQLAASVFHNTAEAIVITDAAAKIISVNPAFTDITGYAADEVIGKTPRVMKSNHHDAAFYKAFWLELLTRGQWQGQIWNRRKDGEAFLASQNISSVRDDTGKVIRFVSVFDDATEMHRKDEHIRHQAYHDALTGLPNRLLLQDRLGHAIEIAKREQGQVAVMFIDLDRFKVVNDSLGHDIGDMLLVQVTERLSECLRKSDTIARLGGDEFVVVVSAFDGIAEVAEVAEKIINRVALPMSLKEHEVHVGASIGIALYPQDGEDATALMKDADTAMYRAKNSGRNTFRFFDAAMDGAAVERLLLESALRHALTNGEFKRLLAVRCG